MVTVVLPEEAVYIVRDYLVTHNKIDYSEIRDILCSRGLCLDLDVVKEIVKLVLEATKE